MRLLAVDRGALLVLFVLPVLFLFVMSLALQGLYAQGQKPSVAAVNLDRGPLAARLIARLVATGDLQMVQDTDRTTAERQVREQQVIAALVFAPDFSERVTAQASGQSLATIDFVSDPGTATRILAPLRSAVRGVATQVATEAILPRQMRARVRAYASTLPDPLSILPLAERFENLRSGDVQLRGIAPGGKTTTGTNPDSVQQNVPAWTIFGIFFIVNVLALSLLRERQDGVLLRLRSTAVSPALLLAGKILPYFLVNLVQATLMFALGIGVLHLDPGSRPLALIAVTLATAAAATGLGMLMAAWFETPEQLGATASIFVVILAALGGVLVPTFVMPEFLRNLAPLSPHFWSLSGYQDVLLRGKDLGDVLPQVGALFAFAGTFFGLAVWRWRQILSG